MLQAYIPGKKVTLTIEEATEILAGLANEMRLRIFRALVANGGMPAGELGAELGIGPSTLSFHLKDLRHVGLLKSHKNGRQVIYAANFDNLNKFLGYLVGECSVVNAHLCFSM